MANLLPCRCCERSAGYYDAGSAAGVVCGSCGFDLPPVAGDGRAQARQRWNEFMAADLPRLARIFCSLAGAGGEVVPPSLESELTLYVESERHLVALVAEIDRMDDLRSYLGSRVALPSMHSLH